MSWQQEIDELVTQLNEPFFGIKGLFYMLKKHRSISVILLIASIDISASENEHAHTDDEHFENHASHEHGHATAQITFINDTLNLELLLPSIDVFGFEHTPQNEEQHEKVIQSKSILKDAQNVLIIKPKESCLIKSTEIESVVIDSISEENDHGHDKHDHEEHNDDDEHHENEHSDVNAHYVYQCSNTTPESIEFMLFDHFHTLEDIEVQFVSDETQVLSTVTPDKRTQSLQ